jgi:hypothetical protein
MGTGSVTSEAILDGTIIGADLASNIGFSTTGIVTSAAFYGTFEGTYKGTEQKAAVFVNPFATAEAYTRLPYNASIVSVEVYCDDGTNVTGRVDIGASNWSASAGTTTWAVATGTALPFSYTAYTPVKFSTPIKTGNVDSATVVIHYKRNP